MKFSLICVLMGVLAVPAFFQAAKPKPKPAAPKAKPAATPTKKPVSSATKKPAPKKLDEASEWTRVTAIADRATRVAELEKFINRFPNGDHLTDAAGLLAAARVEAGNDALAASDVDRAVIEFKAAVERVPAPVVQGFWDEGLIRIPSNLYFRDRRAAAVEIAKDLEEKAGKNVPQLLSVARFYLTIEDGAEGKRLSEKAIAADANSAAAYRTLGLAERMQFRLDASAAAFEKAVELEPDSIESRQGLAEMKRATGKPDEALALYTAVLEKQPDNIAAETGRIMALFESGKQSEAEAAMSRSLESAPGNVVLLAGAAYWYAAHKIADKAVEFGKKAIDAEPRFIWGHIAYARGLLLEGRPTDAEAALLGARRYGNFPTLEYEIAVARASGGFYQEAADGLAPIFRAKAGSVSTELGNRVNRESPSFTELVADERRATIFAPTAADDPDTAARLAALLEFEQQMSAATPDENSVIKAADDFVRGDDAMAVHRQLYAASVLLEKKVALAKVVDLAKAAVVNVDKGLDVPAASSAVMASELYSFRRVAAARGEYVNVPTVPRATLSAIVRGRIEDLIGWTAYQEGSVDDALVHLRRAAGVLPADSAWWRSSTWHLGAALAVAGKDSEALEQYIKSYRGDKPDAIRYSIIESLYRKVNGSSDGLVNKIGDNPSQPIAQNIVPAATPETVATPLPTPINSGVPFAATPTPTPTPDATPVAPTQATVLSTPTPVPEQTVTAEVQASPIPAAVASPSPTPTDEASVEKIVATATDPVPAAAKTSDDQKPTADRELFPPVIITIPSSTKPKEAAAKTDPADSTPAATDAPAVQPCEVTSSEDSVTLSGGNRAIIVGRGDDGDIEALEAVSSSPADVAVRREPINGVRARALYVLRAVSGKRGVYQVTFTLPCGTKVVTVNVR